MRRTGRRILAIWVTTLGVLQPALAGQSPDVAIDRLFAAYREGSVEGMLSAYAENASFEDVNQRHHLTGTDQLRAMLTGIADMHIRTGLTEKRRVVNGNTVVVEYEYRGQLDGAALGASVGKEACPDLEYTLPATSWFEVKGGKIVHQKDFIDWATYLELRQRLLEGGTAVTGRGK